MPRALKVILSILLSLLVIAALALGGYFLYLQAHCERIPDNQTVHIEGPVPKTAELERDTTYTALTYNIGYGAFTPSFSFFMDTGVMADGTKTQGSRGKAVSEQSVVSATEGAIKVASTVVVPKAEEEETDDEWWSWEEPEEEAPAEPTSADFMLFQEVDTNSDRSYHVDQKAMIKQAFPGYATYFAENFHSGFLVLPFHDMHGRSNSGLLTLSSVAADTAIRRSYPVDEGIPARFTGLDRCFLVLHIPVAGDGDLVLINHHMSAYDGDGKIRAEQLSMLSAVLTVEREQGNYVIVGGGWSSALAGSQELYPSQQQVPDWAHAFDEGAVPEGFSMVRADNLEQVPTGRSGDIPYVAGKTYTVTTDGFLVSNNVRATAENIDTGFEYSDHNPVLLSFELLSEAA